MKILRTIFFILVFSVMAHTAFAANQMKTTESEVADSDVSVSANQSYPFVLYIGDDLTGITNPLKSLHFTTSGVYTGSGTVTFMIDGDVATTKAFTLPNVGATPTPFEIDYKDSSNKINPTSTGSYSYSLNFNPSGVTVYGLGVKMTETHQYAPPACGTIYGILTSAVFDSTSLGTSAGYNSIMWKGLLGGVGFNQGKVRFQFATSSSSTGPWNYYGGSTCGALDWFDSSGPDIPVELTGTSCVLAWNNKRYFRYKVEICSNDCLTSLPSTPTVNDVIVNWSP